jgi:hypothetical protein
MMLAGRQLSPISAATEAFVRAHLPRTPAEPGLLWVADTCWVATYTNTAMQPCHFGGWHCLNPREETPDA